METAMTRRACKLSSVLGLVLAGLATLTAPARAAEPGESDRALEKDLTVAQRPLYELGTSGKIPIAAWVDHPELIYAMGEPLRLMVRPAQDAYLTVLNVGSSGRVAVLFPNHFQRDTMVKAGQTVRIPDDRADWRIEVGGPAGIDLIKVIASKTPLTIAELGQLSGLSAARPTLALQRSADDMARDLVVQLKPQEAAKEPAYGVRNVLVRIVQKQGPSSAASLQGAFGLGVRSEKLVYRVGESVRVTVSTDKDCRLSLVSIGPTGRAVRLFPNAGQTDTLVRPGQRMLIPSPQSTVHFKASAPTGVQGLIATCRSQAEPNAPRSATEVDFAPAGDLESIGRDLVVTVPAGQPTQMEQVMSAFLVVN
jgi:hypothetical protein